ncbi:hypothetical protein GCM10011575_18930 [Microlunatus endophyticus]|uniref:Uncharacterized protein n=1 Tax=Microlunatus endophyticus TaxID=1716077 RepID=A0A917S7U5_9ACTN|nr:hypothetical protein GCM10011575_18930 [Microlunatus endophyticus]
MAATNLGALGTIGAVRTTVKSAGSGSSVSTTTTSTTGAIKLLGGLVTADGVVSTAVSRHTSAGYSESGSTKVVNLEVAGAPVSANPGKDTTVSLPSGLGTLTLNAQATSSTYGYHKIVVKAIKIALNKSKALSLPSADVAVGYAAAALHEPVHARPYGSAYATRISAADGTVTSSGTASMTLPCAGSDGRTVKNSTAAVKAGKAASVGAVATTGTSTDTAALTSATTSAKLGAASLLNGLIKVDAITVKATSSQKPGAKVSTSSSGTKIAGLTINGKSVKVSGRANQKINIAGIGTLWVHKTVTTSRQIQVYGLQLDLLKASSGLKAGSTVTVGYAGAGVH